jgi:hypothetical protein
MRRLILSAVTLGALSVGSIAAPAEATGTFKVVKFTATSVTVSGEFGGSPQCDAAGNCVVSYTVSSQLSGDLQGTFSANGLAYTKPGSSGFQFSAMGIIVGSVRGCGSGSFAIYEPLNMAGSTTITGNDVMVPDSGTGDLAGSSQVGPWTYKYDPQTSTSTDSGSIRCRVG